MSTTASQTAQHSLELFAKDEARDAADASFLKGIKAPPPVVGPDFEIVDLFAGCGGLSIGAIEGARRAGRTAGIALAVDSDPDPLAVLQRSLSLPSRCVAVADLSDVLAPLGGGSTKGEQSLFAGISRGPLLLAGPPCQGHSALNNHTRHDDPRNDLYLAVGRVARILKPAAVIVENVRGIDRDRRSSVARCSSVLEELGYHVTTRRIDLSTLGVPQRRIRHLLVATLDQEFDWNLPVVQPRDLAWAIGDLAKKTGSRPFDSPSSPSAMNLGRMRWLLDHDEYNLPNELRPKCHRSDHSYRSMYGRLRWDAPAQTITSGFGSMGQGRYVHPVQARTLTPHEAARLQFLPDFLDFETVKRRGALAQMIGNAAPPLLTTVLVQALVGQNLL